MKRLAFTLTSIVVLVLGACSSSSGGGGASSSCQTFCSHLQTGSNCEKLDLADCASKCEAKLSSCPARGPAFLSCLSTLPYTCTGPGYAVSGAQGS